MATFEKLAGDLRDRIWFTRIARIHSEKRLLRNEFHSQLLLMVYSVYSIVLSVTLLKYEPISQDAGAVFGAVLSVTLFGLSFYQNARGFPARAQRFKENYTHLQELTGRLDLALCQPTPAVLQTAIEEVQAEYKTATANSENHTTTDDRCARFAYGQQRISRKLTEWDLFCVFAYSTGRYLSLGLLYLSPLAIFGYMLCTMQAKA